METQALWHISASKSLLQKSNEAPSDKILIKSLFSMISLGTERLVACGKTPSGLFDSMTVPYMEGQFSFPIKYGYSLVGQVQTQGHALTGKQVHLLHPHQNFCLVNPEDIFIIPDGIDLRIASLASNLETAVNAIWDAKVGIGDKVLIVGFGLVGSLVARLVSMIPGTEVQILDTDPQKILLAKKLGFDTVNSTKLISQELKFDIAFNCSVSSAGLQSCINATGFESKIIELSWYGDQSTTIQLGGTFHQQRKQVISSQVSNLPMDRRGRWDFHRRKIAVFNLLKNPIFKHHISQTIKFAASPKYFEKIRQGVIKELGVLINYE